MGGLFSRKDLRVVMVGLDGAGKTTIVQRFKGDIKVITKPTLGFTVETVVYKKAKFTIWDLGGQDRYRAMWRDYFTGIHAVIFVVDSEDRGRMDESAHEFKLLMETPELRGLPVLVFANKTDKPGAMFTNEVSSALGLEHLTHRQWCIQASVATEGVGLSEGFDWLHRTL
ncbi:ADP-ribosylation factor [Pelomyxa schiedti]|nr:ADP-ribosylation factor [Pelomyxa schiedti]